MATTIKVITGDWEYYNKNYKPKFANAELSVTRYAGGKEKGTMLQLSIAQYGGNNNGSSSYIGLTKHQVMELAEVLKNYLDYDKHPSS